MYQERASKVKPAGLLRQYQQNRFVQPATLDPRQLHTLGGVAYNNLPDGYEALDLSQAYILIKPIAKGFDFNQTIKNKTIFRKKEQTETKQSKQSKTNLFGNKQ